MIKRGFLLFLLSGICFSTIYAADIDEKSIKKLKADTLPLNVVIGGQFSTKYPISVSWSSPILNRKVSFSEKISYIKLKGAPSLPCKKLMKTIAIQYL